MKRLLFVILTLSLIIGLVAAPVSIATKDVNGNVTLEKLATQKVSDIQDFESLANIRRQTLSNDLYVPYKNTRSTILNEGFEGYFLPDGWSMIDADSDGDNWMQRTGIVNSGTYSTMSVSYFNVDNYLVTPQLTLPQGNIVLEYYIFLSPWHSSGENYSVLVSTTTPTVGAFTEIHFENGALWAFQERHLDLSDYAGQSIYIAFRHHQSSDRDAIILDDVLVYQQHENDIMAVRISGPAMPSVGLPTTHNVTIKNYGFGTANGYIVRIMEGNNELSSVNGISLESLDTYTFQINWIPSTEGFTEIHGEVVWAQDQNQDNNSTPPYPLNVQPEGTIVAFIGDLDSTFYSGNEPLDTLNASSAVMVIYYDDELPPGGVLTHIGLRFNGSGAIQDDFPVQIYLTHTDLQDMWDWLLIPSGEMTKVFDGILDLSNSGEYDILMELNEPFVYEGGNLYMMYFKPWLDGVPYWDDGWANSQPGEIMRTMSIAMNEDIIDIENWSQGYWMWGLQTIPNTTMVFSTEGMGHIAGHVSHNGEDGIGAMVSVDGTTRRAFANSQGEYVIQFIDEGSYDLTASKVGFYDAHATNVTVFENDITTQDFELLPLPTFAVTGRIIASDTDLPLQDARVRITGYADFPTTTTNAQGIFEFPEVYGYHEYYVVVNANGYEEHWHYFQMDTANQNLGDIMVFEIPFPPRNVRATEVGNNMELTWRRPQLPSEKWFTHSVGDWHNYGLAAGNHTIAQRFTPEQINEMGIAGHELDLVSYGMDDWGIVYGLTLKVYTGGTDTPSYNPGNLVHEQVLSTTFPIFFDWIDVFLTSPVTIPSNQELWITFEIIGESYLFTTDEGPARSGYGDLIFIDGEWASLTDYYYDYNWMIRGFASIAGVRSPINPITYSPQSIPYGTHSFVPNSQIESAQNPTTKYIPHAFANKTNPRGEVRQMQETDNSRAMEYYNIYRALKADIYNEDAWTTIQTNYSGTEYTDTTWTNLPHKNIYTYIVQAVYTKDNYSIPAFSNAVISLPDNMDYHGDPDSNVYYQITPISVNLPTALNQSIFLADEFGKGGRITEIMLNFMGDGSAPSGRDYYIYLGYTEKDGFTGNSDWVPFEDFTLVWSGELPIFEPGNYMVNIQLDTPFLYGGGAENLVFMGYSSYVYDQIAGNAWQNTIGMPTTRSMFAVDWDPFPDLEYGYPSTGGIDPCIPNIGFTFSTDGLGNLTGTVNNSANNQPIHRAEVRVTGTNRRTFTNEQGQYSINYMVAGNTSITVSRHGFIDVVFDVDIVSGQTTTRHITMQQMPTVNVIGRVISSDTNAGIQGANITLVGYDDYQVTTNATGAFIIPEVYSSFTYTLTISYEGHTRYVDPLVEVGDSELDLGNIMLFERTAPPKNVVAQYEGDYVRITWEEGGGEDVWFTHLNSYDYEDAWGGNFYPWEIIAVHRFTAEELEAFGVNGAELSVVSFFAGTGYDNTWEIVVYTGGSDYPLDPGTLVYSQYVEAIPEQWNDFVLDSPVDIPFAEELWFGYRIISYEGHPAAVTDYGNGSMNGYIVYDLDLGWMDAYMWGGYDEHWMIRGMASNAQGPIMISKDIDIPQSPRNYDAQPQTISTASRTGLANTRINNSVPPSTSSVRNTFVTSTSDLDDSRAFVGYGIWRTEAVNVHDESTWVEVAMDVTDFAYLDTKWWQATFGIEHVYIVRAIYTNNNFSRPAFSNAIEQVNDIGDLPPVQLVTTLHTNYPNPFNPSTIIAFDKEKEGNVKIDIYNIRGQRVTTLVNENFEYGRHTVEWHGTDANGRSVASGVYFYRMETDEYNSTKRMVLMK